MIIKMIDNQEIETYFRKYKEVIIETTPDIRNFNEEDIILLIFIIPNLVTKTNWVIVTLNSAITEASEAPTDCKYGINNKFKTIFTQESDN